MIRATALMCDWARSLSFTLHVAAKNDGLRMPGEEPILKAKSFEWVLKYLGAGISVLA